VADDEQHRRRSRDFVGDDGAVLALIFSVALLVLSMVATLFSQPVHGHVRMHLSGFPTHQDAQSSFIPQISPITSWALVILSFGFLVYYSRRVASSIQNPDMIGAKPSSSGCTSPRETRAGVPFAGVVDALPTPSGAGAHGARYSSSSVNSSGFTLAAERSVT
jgi:hypothetical protein